MPASAHPLPPSSPRPPPRAVPSRPRRGFTLVEMLATMAVLAVTLAIAGPPLAGLMRSGKVRSAQSELVASLMLARSEAARRGVPVTLRAKGTASDGGLARGWWVWVDSNANNVVDSSETRLRDVPDLGSGIVVTPATTLGAVYSPRGFLAPMAAVSMTVCGKKDERGFTLNVQPAGLADVMPLEKCP